MPPARLAELKSEDSFGMLLTLGRVINALRFAQMAPYYLDLDGSPNANRQLINSFFFQTAILFEGLEVADALGKHFRHLPSFSTHVAPLASDKNVKALRNSTLRTLRNKVVFHFDRDVATAALSDIELPKFVFLSSVGHLRKDVYYNLSDEAALHFLMGGEKATKEEYMKQLDEWITDVTEASLRFADAAERLLVDALTELGLQGTYVDP